MPTKLKKKPTKRTSSRKVTKPTVYGSKPTPPQRGKRLQSKVTKVSTGATKKSPVSKPTGKVVAKATTKKVNKVVEVAAGSVASMPPIGSRSDDLVNTDSDEEISVKGDGKSKYPWNNYSKEYLHGKWKDAVKIAQDLREDKKNLSEKFRT